MAERARLRRSTTDRVVAGVAGGLAAELGVSAGLLRLVFVLLSLAGGSGVVAYLVLWGLVADRAAPVTGPPTTPPDRAVAVGAVTLGVLLLLREAGLWFGDQLVGPAALAAVGSAVVAGRGSDQDRRRWHHLSGRLPEGAVEAVFARPVSPWRLLVGAGLIAVGIGVFLAANDRLDAVGDVALAVAVTAGGVTLVLGPWLGGLGRQLAEERRERIRVDERARVAAHLHDSVLQTLALIQRSADDPRRTVTLARRQERELRAWLYGASDDRSDELLSARVDRLIEEIEDRFDIDVEQVVVGDGPVGPTGDALVQAMREALTNVAKHAGVRQASLYVERGPAELMAYVRDRGTGFDPEGASEGRGIAGSMRERLARHGGDVQIVSEPGGGTEVTLTVPLPIPDPAEEPAT